MSSNAVVIFAEPGGAWRVGVASRAGVSVVDVPAADDVTPKAHSARLAEALRAVGVAGNGERVVLALGTAACLCAPVAAADLPARQRRQAMLYRLEEKLPVAAEEVVADFVFTGNTALGVAVERRTLQPLVEAVEATGVRVQSVRPASLLALQQWIGTSPLCESQMVLWPGGAGRLELFVVAGDAPVGWYTLADDPDDVALYVRMAVRLASQPSSRVVVCGARPEVVRRLEEAGATVIQSDSVSPMELATAAAPGVLGGKHRPWVDLAGGGSSGGAVRAIGGAWAAAAVVAFLACLTVAMLWRAARYERLAARHEAEQQDIFRATFPGQAMPTDVRSRLESEARHGGNATAGVAGAASAQGLVVLRDLMTHLPSEVRFRVFEVRLENDAFTLEGEACSHGDAEAVAAGLRRRPGFAIAAPRTEQQAGRVFVGFTLTGNVVPAGARAANEVERRASR